MACMLWFSNDLPLCYLLIYVCFFASNVVCDTARPWLFSFNQSIAYGPDGPWQAVAVRIGNPGQPIHLYPGNVWSTVIINSSCNGGASCPSPQAPVYDEGASQSHDNATIKLRPDVSTIGFRGAAAMNLNGKAHALRDLLSVSTPDGSTTFHSMNDSLIAGTFTSTYPGGLEIPLTVGYLSLGAPHDHQVFSHPEQSIIANILLPDMRIRGEIPSTSWGLHVGSVPFKIPGSLCFGGYDEARVLGSPGASDDLSLQLIDVFIDVHEGSSPFSNGTQKGLLKDDNAVLKTLKVVPNPAVPYMYLPGDTCNAIANNLPVTYKPELGLYIWTSTDPRYEDILTSPSYLGFTFRQFGLANITIKVQFGLLNLTLEPPLTAAPTPYFPCKVYNKPTDGTWHLGRAFLQAAFLGQNWETSRYFIAQAPGPNVGASSIKSISPSDRAIERNPGSAMWESTWSSVWKPLRTSNSSNSSNSSNPSNSSNSSNSNSDNVTNGKMGMSAGAKAGIGVGISVAVLTFVPLVALVLIRRRVAANDASAAEEDDNVSTPLQIQACNDLDQHETVHQPDISPSTGQEME